MTERKHIYSLDHLRFFAATLVFFHHYSLNMVPNIDANWLTYVAQCWLRWGSTGVSLFIVLSGFLFVIVVGDKKLIYHKFIANRLLRIFPLYCVVMLLLLTASREAWSTDELFRFLLLQVNTGNQTTGWGNDILPFGITWTIAVEFQFYLLFPILLTILRGSDGIKSLAWMILALCVLRFFLGLHKGPEIYYNSYHTLISRLDQFLIGMIAASLWRRTEINKRIGLAFIIAGISILTADVTNHSINLYRVSLGLTVEGAAWSLIIVGYASLFSKNSKLNVEFAKFGNLTFSIYLLHLFFSIKIHNYFVENGYSTGSHYLNVLIYAYIPTLILSIITYMGIERPFLRLKVKDSA